MSYEFRFELLAPSRARPASVLGGIKDCAQLHEEQLRSIQRLRGRVYLCDGAIRSHDVDGDGCFVMKRDEQSWHLLLKCRNDNTVGCARYLVHPSTVALDQLNVIQCAQTQGRLWSEKVRLAVSADLERVKRENLSYVEVGGWAIKQEWRGSRAAAEVLLASYALAPLWGGCLASCTATVRHQSSSILRRFGGTGFEVHGQEVLPYYDDQYSSTMELLRFDSRFPMQKFVPMINEVTERMAGVEITRHVVKKSQGHHDVSLDHLE